MTKLQYQKKLQELLHTMIGEEVNHDSFGLGTIVGFEDGRCLVKYDRFDEYKKMSVERFFDYNVPLNSSIQDDMDALKAEYELSKMKEAKEAKEQALSEQTQKVAPKPITQEIQLTETKPEPKTSEKITFDDVIGLDNVKDLIYKMVVYPFKYQDIYKAFKRDSGGGILLYGAPGTGKTMIAKAIANEIDAKFFSIKCSDIVSKWFGESERKVKEIFESANRYKKSIIFFDEFDSLGSDRENKGLQGNNRIVSELLSQIDGFDSNPNSTILLIASTNKPWNIDSALLRSGRFNKKIYVGLPNQNSRLSLLIHQLKDIPTDNIDYNKIVDRTDGYSSADIVELCNEAKDLAIGRSIKLENISPITNKDFDKAISTVSSTIVKTELEQLENFKL